ncbi:hypothetical protein FHETE_4146 [Fusarium heterosporum]|uniref:Uncharacterized protein n=1 Tax=Fusarium heterosporum TaxID=42747 RepID=A0A8H5TKD6_FUSHE|nr:hypothetical protein FHETE_4146 [Fusarium heterosporum]
MSNQGFGPEESSTQGFSQGGFQPTQGGFTQGGFTQGGFKPADEGFSQGGFQPTEKFNSQGFTQVDKGFSQTGFQSDNGSSQGNQGYQPPGVQEVKRAELSNLRQAIARGKQSLAEAEEILENLSQ